MTECPNCHDEGEYSSDNQYTSTFFCRNQDCRVASFDHIPVSAAMSQRDSGRLSVYKEAKDVITDMCERSDDGAASKDIVLDNLAGLDGVDDPEAVFESLQERGEIYTISEGVVKAV